MTTDLTIARYAMALLLLLIAIPVLAQSLISDQDKTKLDQSIRYEQQARAGADASSRVPGVLRRNVAQEQSARRARAKAQNSDAEESHRARRIDLREWRRQHDEQKALLRRSRAS